MKRFIKNRRGFLLGEETVKIILAIISIVGLIVFVVYWYNAYSANSETKNAEASLNRILVDINSGRTQTIIYNPKDWVLSSWPHDFQLEKNILPSTCLNNKWSKCICICQFNSIGCNEGGVLGACVQSNFSVTSSGEPPETNSILLNPVPAILSINQTNKSISISR